MNEWMRLLKLVGYLTWLIKENTFKKIDIVLSLNLVSKHFVLNEKNLFDACRSGYC